MEKEEVSKEEYIEPCIPLEDCINEIYKLNQPVCDILKKILQHVCDNPNEYPEKKQNSTKLLPKITAINLAPWYILRHAGFYKSGEHILQSPNWNIDTVHFLLDKLIKIFTQMDELRHAEDCQHIGCYMQVQQETEPILHRVPGATELYLRALTQVAPESVDSLVQDTSPLTQQIVKLFCLYENALDSDRRDQILNILDTWMAVPSVHEIPFVQTIAARIYFSASRLEDAWHWASQNCETDIEKLAILSQMCLHQDRPDLCEEKLQQMKRVDTQDSVLSTLVEAWLCTYQRTEESQRHALALYQEIDTKLFGSSDYIHMQIATIHIQLGLPAIKDLRGMFDTARTNKKQINPDGQANYIIALYQNGEPYSSLLEMEKQLEDISPNHQYFQLKRHIENHFDSIYNE